MYLLLYRLLLCRFRDPGQSLTYLAGMCSDSGVVYLAGSTAYRRRVYRYLDHVPALTALAPLWAFRRKVRKEMDDGESSDQDDDQRAWSDHLADDLIGHLSDRDPSWSGLFLIQDGQDLATGRYSLSKSLTFPYRL